MQTPSQPQLMTAAERDAHIHSCSCHFLEAYARFEDFGNPTDRDEAYQWMHMRDAALREREFQRELLRASHR